MSPDKLIRMANQIALFMETKPHAEGVETFANHINDFWDPRQRSQFMALIDNGTPGLRPLVVEAATKIRRPVSA